MRGQRTKAGLAKHVETPQTSVSQKTPPQALAMLCHIRRKLPQQQRSVALPKQVFFAADKRR